MTQQGEWYQQEFDRNYEEFRTSGQVCLDVKDGKILSYYSTAKDAAEDAQTFGSVIGPKQGPRYKGANCLSTSSTKLSSFTAIFLSF